MLWVGQCFRVWALATIWPWMAAPTSVPSTSMVIPGAIQGKTHLSVPLLQRNSHILNLLQKINAAIQALVTASFCFVLIKRPYGRQWLSLFPSGPCSGTWWGQNKARGSTATEQKDSVTAWEAAVKQSHIMVSERWSLFFLFIFSHAYNIGLVGWSIILAKAKRNLWSSMPWLFPHREVDSCGFEMPEQLLDGLP